MAILWAYVTIAGLVIIALSAGNLKEAGMFLLTIIVFIVALLLLSAFYAYLGVPCDGIFDT